MTREWLLQQLVGGLIGVAFTAVVGTPLALVARWWWRRTLQPIADTIPHGTHGRRRGGLATIAGAVVGDARQAAVSASLAAQDTSAVREGQDDIVRRVAAVERAVEAMKDATSASLGHRAVEALRFRAIEQALGLPGEEETNAQEVARGAQDDRRRGRRAAARRPDLGEPDARS